MLYLLCPGISRRPNTTGHRVPPRFVMQTTIPVEVLLLRRDPADVLPHVLAAEHVHFADTRRDILPPLAEDVAGQVLLLVLVGRRHLLGVAVHKPGGIEVQEFQIKKLLGVELGSVVPVHPAVCGA